MNEKMNKKSKKMKSKSLDRLSMGFFAYFVFGFGMELVLLVGFSLSVLSVFSSLVIVNTKAIKCTTQFTLQRSFFFHTHWVTSVVNPLPNGNKMK